MTSPQPYTRQGRATNALRALKITRGFTVHAEGSVLIEFGQTRVLCNCSVLEKVPPHKRGSNEGWVTAEYGMLPRSTPEATVRQPRASSPEGHKRSSASLAALCEPWSI